MMVEDVVLRVHCTRLHGGTSIRHQSS